VNKQTLTGLLLDEHELTVIEIRETCSLSMDQVMALVDEGVLEPQGRDPQSWRFGSSCIPKARAAMRLHNDLGINLAGVALALDLIDELEVLRSRLRHYEADS